MRAFKQASQYQIGLVGIVMGMDIGCSAKMTTPQDYFFSAEPPNLLF